MPARNRSIVIRPVIPRPAAAFSPLTMTKSISQACLSLGTISITAFRPGSPIMSPRNKSRSIAHTLMITPYISSRRSRIKFGTPIGLSMLHVFVPLVCFSQRLTPLSPAPDWQRLNRFQETITRALFVDLLDSVCAPNGAGAQWIKVESTRALIQENAWDQFVLRFASSTETSKPVPRYWIAAQDLGPN